jgi:hypothetical protein
MLGTPGGLCPSGYLLERHAGLSSGPGDVVELGLDATR